VSILAQHAIIRLQLDRARGYRDVDEGNSRRYRQCKDEPGEAVKGTWMELIL
jgi:hypothetical protein